MDKKHYHRQSEPEWCGVASIQMVLGYLAGKSFSSFPDSQFVIKDNSTVSSHLAPWDWEKYDAYFLYPDEIANGLAYFVENNKYEAAIEPTITVDNAGSYLAYAKDYFLMSLQGYLSGLSKFPITSVHSRLDYAIEVTIPSVYQELITKSPVAIYAGHWVVLTKFQEGDTVSGLLGFDPFLPKSIGVPYPDDSHEVDDQDNCHEVIIHISCEEEVFGKNFPRPSRIAIVWKLDSDSSSSKRTPNPKLDRSPLPRKPQSCNNLRFDSAIAQSLFDQMTALGLRAQPPCSVYLSQVTISSGGVPSKFRIGTPRLVRRLDGFCDDYYLVPLLKANGQSAVLARIDAPTGKYLDSLYYFDSPFLIDEATLEDVPTQKDLIETIVPARLIEMGKKKWVTPFQEQIRSKRNPPEMVWLPCKQSISAFLPFFVIKAGKDRFFVRIDGRVFWNLTY